MSYGEAKEWLDTFLDRYLNLQSKSSHPWRLHGLLTILGVRRDVHGNTAATSFAHTPYMQHAENTNASVQCTDISIPS